MIQIDMPIAMAEQAINTPHGDAFHWLIGVLVTALIGLVTWIGKVFIPASEMRIKELLKDHAERLDAKDASHENATREQRVECRNERDELYKQFEKTLSLIQGHSSIVSNDLKEEMATLRLSLNALASAVSQLTPRIPPRPKP